MVRVARESLPNCRSGVDEIVGEVTIGDRGIGDGHPAFVVAEAGINHNGDLDRALEMVTAAKGAGADACKFQTFKAAEFVGDPRQAFTYKSQGREVTEPMIDMFKRCELPESAWKAIRRRCDEEGILFLSTPQNSSDLELLLDMGVAAVKVGSDDFTNLPLLRSYAATGLPLIVSCGMANLAEVYQALEAIGALDGYPTVLMLCTTQYPTPASDVNLLKLKTLARAFPMLPLGFSDHTEGFGAAPLALALGACVFEKHFTLDHALPGPDHWFSEDPLGLRAWVDSIRLAGVMMGSPVVRATAAEEEMKTLARRSIVALRDVQEGELLDDSTIGLRRPGNGLAPSLFESVLGLSAARFVPAGSCLRLGDFR